MKKQYKRLLAGRDKLRERLQDSEEAIVQFKLDYVKKYPLTKATKDILQVRITKGLKFKGLCCVGGRAWLRAHTDLDYIWIEIINQWAYEALGCAQTQPEDIAYHTKRFEKACQTNTWGIVD